RFFRIAPVSNHRIESLAIAVDSPVTLLEAVRIEWQLQVDQVVASLMKVQALRGGIRADEDQVVPAPELLGDGASCLFTIKAAHGHDLPDLRSLMQGFREGFLTVDVLRVDEDVRAGLRFANLGDHVLDPIDLRVFVQAGFRQADHFIELLDDIGDLAELARAAPRLALESRELLGKILGFEEVPFLLLFDAQDAKPVELPLIISERLDPLPATLLGFRSLGDNMLKPLGDDLQRRSQGRDRRNAPFEQRDEGKHVRISLRAERPSQFRSDQVEEIPLQLDELAVSFGVRDDGSWLDDAVLESLFPGLWVDDVLLQPADHVVPVSLAPKRSAAVHE